jgi:transketolase
MTHRALKVSAGLNGSVGVIDVFMLKPIDEDSLFGLLRKYKLIITLEEAFKGKGGLDCLMSNLLRDRSADIGLQSFGFENRYIFKPGNRDTLSQSSHFGEQDIKKTIKEFKRS